jgi:hypothetical protein
MGMATKDILQFILIPIKLALEIMSNRHTRNIEKDREIFKSIKNSFEKDRDLVYFFREHTVGNLTPREDMIRIDRLKEKLERPGFIFTIKELEELRIKLLEKICMFVGKTSVNFFVNTNQSDYYKLKYFDKAKSSMDPEATEKFKQLYKEIDMIGTEIYEIYKELSKQAQKRL